MKNKALAISLFLITECALQARPSLFFTQKEVSHLREGYQGLKRRDLFLSAILYCDKSNWSLWINGEVIRSENAHELEGFRIARVTPYQVEFFSEKGKSFILRPFQRWDLK